MYTVLCVPCSQSFCPKQGAETLCMFVCTKRVCVSDTKPKACTVSRVSNRNFVARNWAQWLLPLTPFYCAQLRYICEHGSNLMFVELLFHLQINNFNFDLQMQQIQEWISADFTVLEALVSPVFKL